ncbi:MAG: putative Zn-dependent protease [Myxococcaceae bacterium]|nr:putative Zn-dependent protease [Myxococcaceae bacterium]
MRKLGLLGALLLSSSGCATLNAIARGDVQGAVRSGAHETGSIAMAGVEGKKESDRVCLPMKDQQVPLGEERAIGGAIAVGLTDRNKAHFFIDGNTEKNLATLAAAQKTPGKVKLPDSERNNLNAYLSQVGRNLASYSPRPEIVWTFGVLESPTVNAFSAPGGYVFVTTGLLKMIDNEAQLAAVLAHEIGHISGRHALKNYSAVKYKQCDFATTGGYMLAKGLDMAPHLRQAAAYAKFFSGGNFDLDSKDMAAGLISSLADGFIDDFITSGLSTPDELEADKYAVELTTFAGYDAGEYEKLLQKLPQGKDDHHPAMADRLKAIGAVRADLAAFAGKGSKFDNSAQLKVVKK